MSVVPRPAWNGSPVKLGDLRTLRKEKGDVSRAATCELWTSVFGWEVRLFVDGEFLRSQICRAADEFLDASKNSKAALIELGWG